jgi:hypothetical protein
MTIRDHFNLTLDDLEDLLRDQERELDELRAEIERREGPGGKPPETGQSGISVREPGLKGPSERSITCARCGRELHSLEQIRATLELAPSQAIAAGQAGHRKDVYSFALDYLTQAVAEAVRDLQCHTGACQKGTP